MVQYEFENTQSWSLQLHGTLLVMYVHIWKQSLGSTLSTTGHNPEPV